VPNPEGPVSAVTGRALKPIVPSRTACLREYDTLTPAAVIL